MTTHHTARALASARTWWPWLLVALAWFAAIVASVSGWRILLDHHFLLEESGLPWPAAAILFLAGWQVMIVAMMVPMSVPVLTGTPAGLRGRFFAGYLLVWTAFGLLAFSGDMLIHHLVEIWPWLAGHTFVIGATTFAAAGLFQFGGWKTACLSACRMSYSRPERRAGDAGIGYGRASVGCCWALMLVMFGVGVGELAWMAGLTAAMLGETVTPGAWRVRQIVGVVLCVLAALWLAHPAWLVPAVAV